MTEKEFVTKIKKIKLGDKEESLSLYFAFCDFLKDKYGLVDRDYDENPTARGKEWIDIHHIREFELDDIARRTKIARNFEKRKLNHNYTNDVMIALKSRDCNDEKMNEIRKQYSGKSVEFWGIDYSLEELKPYNVKEQLVYANKIEHFLLHYLIDSIRGQDVFSGGPNYIWDCCVALDVYGFDKEYLNKLQEMRAKFYSLMSSEEITLLYKKLIDWKNWDTQKCAMYWLTFKKVISKCDEEISYVFDKDKFFRLFNILGYRLDTETIKAIKELPFKVKTVTSTNGTVYKIIGGHIFKKDGTTAILFNGILENKSFTIPYFVEDLAVGAFDRTYRLETITVPITVKKMEDKVFVENKLKYIKIIHSLKISKIIYKGTKEEWNKNFSNVILNDIKLVCKK